LLVKPLQPPYSALFGGTPDPVSATNRTFDGTEIDEHTGGGDEGRYTRVEGKVSTGNSVKKPARHCVDDE
jgi:hypothetical protein